MFRFSLWRHSTRAFLQIRALSSGVESKGKYLRLWWCFSIEHIWIHNITIYDFPLKLPLQCVPLSHNSLVLFFNLFPSIKFYVCGKTFFPSTTTAKGGFVLNGNFVCSMAKNINDSALFFIWHKWHTQMNNAKKRKCFVQIYLRSDRLAINFQGDTGLWISLLTAKGRIFSPASDWHCYDASSIKTSMYVQFIKFPWKTISRQSLEGILVRN